MEEPTKVKVLEDRAAAADKGIDHDDAPTGASTTEEAANGTDVVASSSTQTNNENEGHPFLRALQYDLVADELVSFLNFEDMKALSAVSRDSFACVRKTKIFSDRARLSITKEIISHEILKNSTYLWKHISLDLSLPVEIIELIDDMLKSAESLCIKLPTHKADNEVVHYLEELLHKTKNLKILEIDVTVFNKILHDVFSDVCVQTLMGKLECLAIHGFSSKPDSVCYIDGCGEDEETPFQRNFLQLSLVPLHLKRFSFGKVIPVTGSESEHVKFIPKILGSTKDTLEDLVLHLHIWKFDEMKGIRCPKLKRLTLSAYGKEQDAKIVNTFLKNQPPLEELVISMKDEFPVNILLTLQGLVSKMRKLQMKTKRFVGTSEAVDWNFLQSMTKLDDFFIRKPATWNDDYPETYGYGEEILACLPSRVKNITMEGFHSFWREEVPNINNIGLLVTRFENLRELNLLRSSGAMTDEGLQSIVSNCTKLVALTFSHCHQVTDFGMSGVVVNEDGSNGEKTGVALNELKGLTTLKIRSCPNVTPECMLRVVEFPFLRSFDYYKNVQLPKQFLFQIARQNPCLESVALHITSYENDVEYFNSLRKEVRQINPRVHLIEILEQTNWEDDDSDSDASSIRDGQDSDVSGGGYNQYGFDADEIDDDYDDSPYFEESDDGDYYDL